MNILVEVEQTCTYLDMRSSYAKARRRENCRPTVVIRFFAFVSHKDAAHSAISLHVAIKRLKFEHLLKRNLLRAILVGFEHRYGNLEPFRKYSFVRDDLQATDFAYNFQKCHTYNKALILLNAHKLHATIGFIETGHFI